jgi:hypothetical protein
MHSFIYLINADPLGSVVKQSGNFSFARPAKVVGGGLEGWRGSFFLSLENKCFLAAFLFCTGINYNCIMGPDPETCFHCAAVPDSYCGAISTFKKVSKGPSMFTKQKVLKREQNSIHSWSKIARLVYDEKGRNKCIINCWE